jgi:hypothetical protein
VSAPLRRAERSRLLFPNSGRLRHTGWSPPQGGSLDSLAALATQHGHGALTRATHDNLVAVLPRTRTNNRLATTLLVSAGDLKEETHTTLLRKNCCARKAPSTLDKERHNSPY